MDAGQRGTIKSQSLKHLSAAATAAVVGATTRGPVKHGKQFEHPLLRLGVRCPGPPAAGRGRCNLVRVCGGASRFWAGNNEIRPRISHLLNSADVIEAAAVDALLDFARIVSAPCWIGGCGVG